MSLSQLFDLDPKVMTPEERREVVAKLRQAREDWIKEEEQARSAGRRAKTSKGVKRPKKKGKIDLSSLDLDINFD